MKVFKLGRKNIGTYYPEHKLFIKDNVYKSKHLFGVKMKPAKPSWGIDSNLLDKLAPDTIIRIDEQEEQIRYTVTVEKFKAYGWYLHFVQPTEDHRTQKFLGLEYFTQIQIAPKQIIVLTQDQLDENKYLISMGLRPKWSSIQ